MSKHNRPPKYIRAVVAEMRKLRERGAGIGLYNVTVLHDDWCNLLAGKGPCNCNPEVQKPQKWVRPENN